MTPFTLLWLIFIFCTISFAVPTRTYSVATGNGNLFRPGFHDSFDGFVKRSIPFQKQFLLPEIFDQEYLDKRSVALGRTNFRPAKRSMAMGRIGFRPGKRSVAIDNFMPISTPNNPFQTSEFKNERQFDQTFFPVKSMPRNDFFVKFGKSI